MTPFEKMRAALRLQGKGWGSTEPCGRVLIQARAKSPHHLQRCLELLSQYGAKRAGVAALRREERKQKAKENGDLPSSVAQWVEDNIEKFAPNTSGRPPGGWWGRWEGRQSLYVPSKRLRELMRDWGVLPDSGVQQLIKWGMLVRPQGGSEPNRLTKQRSFDKRQLRCYELRLMRKADSAASGSGAPSGVSGDDVGGRWSAEGGPIGVSAHIPRTVH